MIKLQQTIKYQADKIEKISNNIKQQTNYPINNQLINMIVEKDKFIEELKITKYDNNEKNQINITNNQPKPLTLNNIIITSRSIDNYINATQLCQAGGKHFKHWYSLESTKLLINEAASETGITTSQLVDVKKGNSSEFKQGSWIHPDLAIQLAQWISPKFALQVSKWIRLLLTNGSVNIKEYEKELKLKDQKIKLLEDAFVKRQKRVDYPEKNIIYILTTEDNKKNRIYIIGKAKNLKSRLTTYNKTAEHEVVYYKSCESEDIMNAAEIMILNKLKDYREKANRDRFILPIDKNISFFTNIVDKTINI